MLRIFLITFNTPNGMGLINFVDIFCRHIFVDKLFVSVLFLFRVSFFFQKASLCFLYLCLWHISMKLFSMGDLYWFDVYLLPPLVCVVVVMEMWGARITSQHHPWTQQLQDPEWSSWWRYRGSDCILGYSDDVEVQMGMRSRRMTKGGHFRVDRWRVGKRYCRFVCR